MIEAYTNTFTITHVQLLLCEIQYLRVLYTVLCMASEVSTAGVSVVTSSYLAN